MNAHQKMYTFCFLCILIFTIGNFDISSGNADKDWDLLIFSQHWPVSVCVQWKEQLPQHVCVLPKTKDMWTVHGIWPTKLGTKGPWFCNSTIHFNLTLLKPIEEQLIHYWADIHNGSIYNLWKHEWKKHGTCATQLALLDSEIKYFDQGLKWIQQYPMQDILAKSGIVPNNQGYTIQSIWDAVKKVLGKNPRIQCIGDAKTKESYLFEIRICFDKNFTLVDCDGIKGPMESSKVGIKTNCPLNNTIIYPSILPPTIEEPFYIQIIPILGNYPWLLEALKFVQFMQWMTL